MCVFFKVILLTMKRKGELLDLRALEIDDLDIDGPLCKTGEYMVFLDMIIGVIRIYVVYDMSLFRMKIKLYCVIYKI